MFLRAGPKMKLDLLGYPTSVRVSLSPTLIAGTCMRTHKWVLPRDTKSISLPIYRCSLVSMKRSFLNISLHPLGRAYYIAQ
jgi:hypothetical protein